MRQSSLSEVVAVLNLACLFYFKSIKLWLNPLNHEFNTLHLFVSIVVLLLTVFFVHIYQASPLYVRVCARV